MSIAYLHQPAPDDLPNPLDMRDSMALVIARRLAAGQPIDPDDLLTFQEADSMVGELLAWRQGSAFGL